MNDNRLTVQAMVMSFVICLLVGFADVPEKSDTKPVLTQPKLEDMSGVYSYTGVEKGEQYKGVVVLTGEPPVYRVGWLTEDGGVFRGTALQDEGVLAVGWSITVGVHPAQGPILKQGVMVFRRDGEKWRSKWTTGERVSVEEWQRLAK